MPANDPFAIPMPVPTPEHQRRITKGKWFEIVTVVVLIIGGVSFLQWRSSHQHSGPGASTSLKESVHAIEDVGGKPNGEARVANRQCLFYLQPLANFACHVGLIGENADAPLETALVWLTPLSDGAAPTPESLQEAVNHVGRVGQALVPSSGEAMERAAKTMEFMSDVPRPFDKGVAGSNDGWKVTYVTYRSYDETAAEPRPMLCFVLQRLSAGSNDELSVFNRDLYEAINQGGDLRTALETGA